MDEDKANDEKPLTLEEIAQLAERVTSWDDFHYTRNYIGILKTKDKKIEIWASKTGFFSWSKEARVSVCVITNNASYPIGEIEGKEVYPIYQRIQTLCHATQQAYWVEKQKQKVAELNEVRRRYFQQGC